MAPEAAVKRTSCSFDCPCRLPIARRRELLRPCSRACTPCSRDRLPGCGTANGAGVHSYDGHPWPVEVRVARSQVMDDRQRSRAFIAPLHDAEHRSAQREQGAYVRAQGCASSRRPAWREKHREVEATRCCRNRRAGRLALVTFPERKVTRSAGAERNQDRDVDASRFLCGQCTNVHDKLRVAMRARNCAAMACVSRSGGMSALGVPGSVS